MKPKLFAAGTVLALAICGAFSYNSAHSPSAYTEGLTRDAGKPLLAGIRRDAPAHAACCDRCTSRCPEVQAAGSGPDQTNEKPPYEAVAAPQTGPAQ